MLYSFFQGLLFGLPFVFVIGPALFAILQTSVSKGFYSGMQLAIGISSSDLLLMMLCYFGVIKYIQNDTFQIVLGFVGTVFLAIYGVYMFRKKTVVSQTTGDDIKLKINWMGVFSEVSKGFFLNIMNPLLWVLWFGIVSSNTGKRSSPEAVLFMLGIVCMIFSTDMLKSFFANKLTKLLSYKVILTINKVAGVILMVCAAYLFVATCKTFNIIQLPPFFNILFYSKN
jgi:threonine/homoserine/homoserine lactone efflux protein